MPKQGPKKRSNNTLNRGFDKGSNKRDKREPARTELRIIGGQWRSRRLSFQAAPGLRPTQDRDRETLFNWLMHHVDGARCLDLFAGSGALGLEALSRGAIHVDFVEAADHAAAAIRSHLQTLQCRDARVFNQTAERWLKQQLEATAYDIIFLDPPFHEGLLQPCLYRLEYDGYLHPDTLIYVESESTFTSAQLPPHWQVIKEKSRGQSRFLLAQCATPRPHIETDAETN